MISKVLILKDFCCAGTSLILPRDTLYHYNRIVSVRFSLLLCHLALSLFTQRNRTTSKPTAWFVSRTKTPIRSSLDF